VDPKAFPNRDALIAEVRARIIALREQAMREPQASEALVHP
jgi:hypothetical protein